MVQQYFASNSQMVRLCISKLNIFLPGNFLAKPKPLSFKGGKWLLFSTDFQPRMSFSGRIFYNEIDNLVKLI